MSKIAHGRGGFPFSSPLLQAASRMSQLRKSSGAASQSLVHISTPREGLSQRATACKAPRQRWYLRQPWQCGTCNLQNLKGPVGFESHPLRQYKPLKIKWIQVREFLACLIRVFGLVLGGDICEFWSEFAHYFARSSNLGWLSTLPP